MDTFEKDEPVLSTGEFVGTEILFVLPIIGLFVAIMAYIGGNRQEGDKMILLMFLCTLIGVSIQIAAMIGIVCAAFTITGAIVLLIVGLLVLSKTTKKTLGKVLSIIAIILIVLPALFIPVCANILGCIQKETFFNGSLYIGTDLHDYNPKINFALSSYGTSRFQRISYILLIDLSSPL